MQDSQRLYYFELVFPYMINYEFQAEFQTGAT